MMLNSTRQSYVYTVLYSCGDIFVSRNKWSMLFNCFGDYLIRRKVEKIFDSIPDHMLATKGPVLIAKMGTLSMTGQKWDDSRWCDATCSYNIH